MKGCPDCAKYEKLLEACEKRIQDLEEKVALLTFELEELKSKRYKPKKPPKDSEPLLLCLKRKAAYSAI